MSLHLSPGSLRVHVVHFLLVRLAQQAVPAPLHRGLRLGAAPRGLQTQAVLRAQPLRQTLHRGHQLVPPQRADLPVRQDVELAEGRQANQARLDRPQLALHRAEVARHVPDSPEVKLGRRERFAQLELVDDLGEHRVPPQHRPRAERLPALGAAELARIRLVPVVVDARHAVGVSAGGGHRVLKDVQAHGTPELALRDRDIRLGHLRGGVSDLGWFLIRLLTPVLLMKKLFLTPSVLL